MVVPLVQGETLGQRHRGYNTVLQELLKTRDYPDTKLNDSDINNFLKIDIASHNRDVEYILDVLKGEDMLYVSRALAQCTWLVTDQQYANIINPDYLQSELFPNMTTKAIFKFKKHIRHNMKDEARAQMFYLNEKNKTDSIKWLPYCSTSFIVSHIEDHIVSFSNEHITLRLFKRLSEKSISVSEIILKKLQYYEQRQYLQAITFFLNTDIDKYLDILENDESRYGFPMLNHKATDVIMKHSPKRVTDKIEKYISMIHIPTFVKHLKAEEIKAFLYAQAEKDLQSSQFSNLRKLFYCDTLKLFIRRLPKNEQFDFVKKVCIQNLPTEAEAYQLRQKCTEANPQSFVWFQFAPFEVAFEEITKSIPLSVNNQEKRSMLSLLIKCTDHNLQHIQTILSYYLSNHKKEESSYKLQFVTEILKYTRISKYDEITWNILNKVLTSMKIYETPSELSMAHSEIVNSIIIYNTLKDRKAPEAIEKLFAFDTLKSYRTDMNLEQQNKMFDYLYEYLLVKLKNPVSNEKDLTETIATLENVLKLVQDWGKSFLDYPLILNKIRDLIKLKNENSWKTSLSSLYNINKSWRKHMFEESVALYPTEEVCLNALKHEPLLLARHSDEVNKLKTDKTVSLRRLHAKLRVYWPESLAQQWIDTYMNNINEASGQNAAVKGLCILLAQKPLLEFIEKYKPVQAKIDWKQIDEHVLNVQRLLAKNMHLGRPQPIPDAIISYAKGDYLQFALPSLLAIFYNLKSPINKQYIPKLLDAPVSVQKHGIRHAFKTLDRAELKIIFSNCWSTSKNATIRALIFKYTFTLLCSEKDTSNAISLWELLELFIDNLTFTEDKDTYELLSKVENVPLNVRSKFLIKSYNFLQKLIPTVDESTSSNYKWFCANLAEHTREVMDSISPDFVLTIINEFIEHDFFNCETKFVRSIHHSQGIIRVISAYLLHAKSEADQIKKYDAIMVPLMQRSFEKWGEKRNGDYTIRQHFQSLLTRLSYDLKDYVAENKMIIPEKMFSLIQIQMEESLSIPENYLMLTKWKLTVALAKLAVAYSCTGKEWDKECGDGFGKICLDFLKEDVALHFPCIYVLFSKCVKSIINNVVPEDPTLEFYKVMLSDKDFIQGYLASIEIGLEFRKDEKYEQIWKEIFSHPSVEVKMHYYSKIDERKNNFSNEMYEI